MQYAPTRVPDSFLFFDFGFSCIVGTQKHTSSKHVPGQTSPPSAEGLIFFWFFSCIKARKGHLPRAGKFAGYIRTSESLKLGWRPWRLDFLLGLFLHQDKKRPSAEGWEVWPGTLGPLKVSNLAGIPDALIFFWFFSCIKARKEYQTGEKSNFWNFDMIGIPFLFLVFCSLLSGRVGAYRIRTLNAAGGGE